ncbi:hypothetical protein [Streptomyces sp. HPF1205]|uniref:hypothetical protein n=1 Tax=Streptomyces sp. HPF1205 TaxID=2873262 RepID=UPI001CEC6103|nr:hypothetical protein [Streptomyces sp. HPF1205]
MTSSDDDPNAPLPRMSRADAQAWATHFTQSMARSAGVEIVKGTVKPEFNDCIGAHDELMHDGRYTLIYRAEAPLTREKQGDAARRVMADLKKLGYRIDSFRDDDSVDPPVVLEARSPEKNFTIDVSGYKSPQVLDFTVMTPCLLPPGVKQQKL